MEFRILQVAHAGAAWRETVRLRHAVLRAPLGLAFTADELAREASQLHLALHADGQLAGVVVLVPPAACATIWKLRQMAVASGRQGQGIGTALVSAAEDTVRARGGDHLRLDARADAVPFYARLGYAAEGAMFEAVTIPHQRMSKRLPPASASPIPPDADIPPPRRSPAIALIVAGTGFMQILDGAIISTSLPQMARSFGATTVDLSLGITAYILASAAISPLATWLAERFGSRRVMLGAIAAFTAASVACGLAPGLALFLAARVVQGLGGALMFPVGMAVVMRHATRSEIMRATATTTWPALTAPILGPVLGGAITQAFGWRWNFFLNVPLGLLAALAIWRAFPDDRSAERRPLDLLGLALCAGSLTCLLLGFQRSAEAGGARLAALGLVLAGLGGGALTVRHLRRHPAPLLSLEPLRHGSLRVVALAPGSALRASFAATTFMLPLMFQLGFGLSPAAAGSWVLVYFCGNLGIKPLTSPIMRRWGFRHVLLVDGILVALSVLAFAFVTPGTPRVLLIGLLLFAGAVRSTELTALNTLTYAEVPGTERRAASNLAAMLQQASFAAGIAVGAFSLSLFQGIHGAVRVGLPELHAAFVVAAGVALAGALLMRGMPGDMGREVSGHAG